MGIYIQNGSLAKREKPVHFVVVASCTELKDGRFVVDDLQDVSQYVQAKNSGVSGDKATILAVRTLGYLVLLETSMSFTRRAVSSVIFRGLRVSFRIHV